MKKQIKTDRYRHRKIAISKTIKAVFIFALISFSTITGLSAQGGDHAEVEAAVEQFYVALNAMFTGDVTPMKAVWSHADDVTYMGPAGGIRVGWPEVSADWEAQAALQLGGKIEPGPLHITIGPRIAIVVNEERGENVDTDGNVQKVSLRATHIFRREKGQWKMIGDHVDLLSFLSQSDKQD